MSERGWNWIPDNLEGAAREAALSRREFLRRSAYTAGIGLSAATLLSPERVLAEMARAQRSVVPSAANIEIDHFVILMMENRSFDHYFGWRSDANASQSQSYNDPSGTAHSTQHAPAILGDTAQWQGCGFGDPGHGWEQGRAQLSGGFLAAGSGNDEFALSFYNEGELGFIHPAAGAYTLYDNYFCSLLGPTWPNRYYEWSAQSGGLKDNSPTGPASTAGNQWDTIFDRVLQERPTSVTARYFNSDLPFSAVWGARGAAWTSPIAEYYAHCASGTLPNITIVDPPFKDGGGGDGISADEHPLGDVRLGQAFMADVAHAFLESPCYKRGALFIIYDEWGGFFDHVTPPKASDDRASTDINEDFSQMGFRTPTTVLSPYTLGGGVSSAGAFGHESILKLIEQRFALTPLCARDRDAVSIGESFNWSADPCADIPDLPHPHHIVSKPCTAGGGDILDGDGAHARDMDDLEELAHRFGVPVGDGRPHEIFRAPDGIKQGLATSAR
jgi:phospholipase C